MDLPDADLPPSPAPAGLARADARAPVRSGPSPAHRIASERLFAGAAEVQIDHRGTLYRLRQTALGKLILTK